MSNLTAMFDVTGWSMIVRTFSNSIYSHVFGNVWHNVNLQGHCTIGDALALWLHLISKHGGIWLCVQGEEDTYLHISYRSSRDTCTDALTSHTTRHCTTTAYSSATLSTLLRAVELIRSNNARSSD